MRMYLRAHGRAVVLGFALVTAACVIVSSTTRIRPLTPGAAPVDVRSPLRVHMASGEVVVFTNGARVSRDQVSGAGIRHDVTRTRQAPASLVSMDSVIGIEVIERQINPGRTLLYSTVTLSASAVLAAALAVAIFGSCPTIYADSAGIATLQAESFSYSISSLLAKRDVDRLNVRPDSNGVVRLEVRNEALETHYIDQLELLEARHDPDEMLLPAARRGLVAVRNVKPVERIRDARGRDVARVLAREDEAAFGSDDALLRDAAEGRVAPEDHLDIVVPRDSQASELALVLKLRSSLLSTTIFYEHMLARPGARSLDWIGRDMSSIASVAGVARWYTDNFGLRVLVRDGERWRPVVRLMDFGPVAWRHVAAVVPNVSAGDSLHIRLAFAPDEWRIDRVGYSWQVRQVEPRVIPLARMRSSDGAQRGAERDQLRRADDRFLVTEPGSRFFAEFDAGKSAGARTFLIAADGYYIEWIRPSWIRSARDSLPFSPQTTQREVLQSWLAQKDTLERRFFRDRVPVP